MCYSWLIALMFVCFLEREKEKGGEGGDIFGDNFFVDVFTYAFKFLLFSVKI